MLIAAQRELAESVDATQSALRQVETALLAHMHA